LNGSQKGPFVPLPCNCLPLTDVVPDPETGGLEVMLSNFWNEMKIGSDEIMGQKNNLEVKNGTHSIYQ